MAAAVGSPDLFDDAETLRRREAERAARIRTFFVTYAACKQAAAGEHPERCLPGATPSLHRVSRALGRDVAVTWVHYQISETAALWQSADTLTDETARAGAEAIVSTYGTMAVGAFMLYLCRLRAGAFGKVAFGRLTIDALVSGIPQFLTDLRREGDRLHREAEERARRLDLELRPLLCVTHDEARRLLDEALLQCDGNRERALALLRRRDEAARRRLIATGNAAPSSDATA